MIVICINNGPMINSIGLIKSAPELIEGNPYTVIYETHNSFRLAETEPGTGYTGYNKRRFVPCSDIDETELIRERQTELA